MGSGPSISGQRPRSNNFTVEGVDNNSLSVTGPPITIPNDAVDNFTVLQNQFSPEFRHSSGGQFNQTIKSGSNQFHGKHDHFQNRNLNAIDSQTALSQVSNGETPSNPRYDNNRDGGNFGGPILKNKLFFFTDWEYNPIGGQTATPSTACLPAGYAQLATLFHNQSVGYAAEVRACRRQLCQRLPQHVAVFPGLPTNFWTNNTAVTNIPVGPVGFIGPSFSNTLNTANSFDWNISEQSSSRAFGVDKVRRVRHGRPAPDLLVHYPPALLAGYFEQISLQQQRKQRIPVEFNRW